MNDSEIATLKRALEEAKDNIQIAVFEANELRKELTELKAWAVNAHVCSIETTKAEETYDEYW